MLTNTIKSYLYWQYQDDEDLQAFVDAYNAMTQQYVTFFNAINLPIYTNLLISGALLDWVAVGLYGIERPTLTAGSYQSIGDLDSYKLDTMRLDDRLSVGTTTFSNVSDDIFRRMLTWALYKGDGKTFTTKWLKRRIMRFLAGVNGTAPDVSNTGQVSVVFSAGNIVTVVISPGLVDISAANLLIQAIGNGVCELPFQYTFNVSHT